MKKLLYVVAVGVLVWPAGGLAQESQPPGGEPGQDQQEQNQNQGQEQAAQALPEPEVELLNAGAEPRRELRYEPEPGQSERATFANTMSATVSANGQQMPAQEIPQITMIMRTTATEAADGAFGYTFKFEDVQVAEGQASAMMRQAIAPLIGVSGEAEISRRGETLSFDITGLDEMPAMMRGQIESMSSQASQFTLVLPEEPVGVGARWRVVTSLTDGEIEMEQTSTATLKAIEGDVVTIGLEIEQTAPEQVLAPPQMGGQKMTLLGLEGKGSGEMKLDTSRLVPLQSAVSIKTTMRMAMGPDQTIEQTMTMKMEMSGEVIEDGADKERGEGEGEDPANRDGNG